MYSCKNIKSKGSISAYGNLMLINKLIKVCRRYFKHIIQIEIYNKLNINVFI